MRTNDSPKGMEGSKPIRLINMRQNKVLVITINLHSAISREIPRDLGPSIPLALCL